MKLNKKVLASLIAAGILTTGTALANPFDDVPKGHWAYDAVQTLADQGVVEGFNDNTYRGDKLMTRYEMAQIVARAMSKNKGVANPTLDKLSAEYADELTSLGVKVDNLEKSTAGVKDLKISHWIQTENTYGKNYDKSDLHEYELEYRLTFEKQISEKFSALHQIETKTYWDTNAWGGGHEDVYTRLAYITYKPDNKTTIEAGKNAHWFAGGLLGDDYLKAINITTKLSDKTTFQAVHGRYWLDYSVPTGNKVWSTPVVSVKPDNSGFDITSEQVDETKSQSGQINYFGLNTKLGSVDFGAHYMTGQHGMTMPGHEAKIWALTAGADLGGVNLSLGYAENTEEDNDNTLTKVQLYKKLGKVDTFLQYWDQEGNYNPPMENGNHMAWWGHQYGGQGVEGFRLILGYPVSPNCYAEAWYGNYDTSKDGVNNDNSATKYGWALTFSY